MARIKQVAPQRVAAAKALATKRVAEAPANDGDDGVQAKVARVSSPDAEPNDAESKEAIKRALYRKMREVLNCYDGTAERVVMLREVCEPLEAAGGDVECNDRKRALCTTTAMAVSGRPNPELALEVLLKHGLDVNRPNINGITALIDAAEGGYHDSIKAFIDAGADVNLQGGRSQWTALHYATNVADPVAVKILLDHGAQVDILDKGGKTALALAKEHWSEEKAEVIQLLEAAAAKNDL